MRKEWKLAGFMVLVLMAIIAMGALYPFNPLRTTNPIQTEVSGTVGDQAYVSQVTYTAPAAASATYVVAAASGAARTIVAASMTNPDMARRLQLVSTTATSATCVVTGTNIAGTAINETVTLSGTTTVYTLSAYKTLVTITVPVGKVVNIGIDDALGLPYKGLYLVALSTFLNDSIEGTAPTITASATLGKCLINLNSALNATDVDVFLIW